MNRKDYKIFSEGKIGTMTFKNRLVRSGTYEPGLWKSRKMSDDVIERYRELAAGGVGLIISTGLHSSYGDLVIDGILHESINWRKTGCAESGD